MILGLEMTFETQPIPFHPECKSGVPTLPTLYIGFRTFSCSKTLFHVCCKLVTIKLVPLLVLSTFCSSVN